MRRWTQRQGECEQALRSSSAVWCSALVLPSVQYGCRARRPNGSLQRQCLAKILPVMLWGDAKKKLLGRAWVGCRTERTAPFFRLD